MAQSTWINHQYTFFQEATDVACLPMVIVSCYLLFVQEMLGRFSILQLDYESMNEIGIWWLTVKGFFAVIIHLRLREVTSHD
jgi:hypothetical protein